MVTIGCELEAGYRDASGQFVDTLAVLNGGIQTGRPYEQATSDMARASLELVTTPCKSGADITRSFDRLQRLLPSGYEPVFETRPFGAPEVPLARKSRVPAMIKALAREHPMGAHAVATVAPHCSTQYHIGVPDLMTGTGVRLLDVLNNIAPYARARVIGRLQIEGTEGHCMIWHGWADERRLPSPRWFGTTMSLHNFVATVPKLLTHESGEWDVVPLGTKSRLEDSESIGTIWWLARPRFFASGPTIEWRPFPSMTPSSAAWLADEVLRMVRAYRAYLALHPIRDTDVDSAEVRALYRHMSQRSFLVPERPLTPDEWWVLFQL